MTVINTRTPLGGAIYPFLHRQNRRWAIIRWDVSEKEVPRNQPPTLRWVNGHHVNDLYVEGMDTEQFLAATGLHLSMASSGFVLSKRISRLMRPYCQSGFFPSGEVTIQYLDLDQCGQKIWDGAGRVRRSLLLRLIDHLPGNLSRHKRRQLKYELRHVQRVEFTIMTERGQDKGHAYVMDDLDTDFVLPPDSKSQVKLTDGTVFVGLYPVHAADEMRLDIQSLVNLWPFFDVPQLAQWLVNEGDLFIQSIRSGEVNDVMSRIDSGCSLEEVEYWHLREYFLSGGHAMWFGSIVKSLINQHLKRIHHTTLSKLRLPIPGGRYYLMTDTIGGRDIPPGCITLDPASATAWVNHNDWCDYISDVLGGADQDDALWVHPFNNHDGERKILCWRSPNQVGEYVLLRPTDDCHTVVWRTGDEPLLYPPGDSRKLPPRIDTVQVNYLNLVDDAAIEGGPNYSVAAIQPAIERARANGGALGQYCNLLLLAKALYDCLPAQPPAPLETVIDASVKTGADLSPIREWCYAASGKILSQGKPVPAVLHDRLSARSDRSVPASDDHWLDDLVDVIHRHIRTIKAQRDHLMVKTIPPLALFQHVFEQPETLQQGAKLSQLYTGALPWVRGKRRRSGSYELARQRSQAYLARFPPDRQTAVLCGALAHYYLKTSTGHDGAAWQIGERVEEGRKPGIAQLTIRALREIGILDELAETETGIVRYPGAKVLEATGTAITITGVWFNWYRAYLQSRGQSLPEMMNDVAKEQAHWAKEQVTQLTRTQFRNLTLTIRNDDERKIAYTLRGNIFGYIAREDTDKVGDAITVRFGIVKDGNLRCIVS